MSGPLPPTKKDPGKKEQPSARLVQPPLLPSYLPTLLGPCLPSCSWRHKWLVGVDG